MSNKLHNTWTKTAGYVGTLLADLKYDGNSQKISKTTRDRYKTHVIFMK